jgi:hypothetical protein
MDKWVGDVVALERLLAQSRVANFQASVAYEEALATLFEVAHL